MDGQIMELLKGEVVIKIRQSQPDGDFFGWEGELSIGGEVICGMTGPTFWDIFDVTDVFHPDLGYDPEDLIDMDYFRMDLNKELNKGNHHLGSS